MTVMITPKYVLYKINNIWTVSVLYYLSQDISWNNYLKNNVL